MSYDWLLGEGHVGEVSPAAWQAWQQLRFLVGWYVSITMVAVIGQEVWFRSLGRCYDSRNQSLVPR